MTLDLFVERVLVEERQIGLEVEVVLDGVDRNRVKARVVVVRLVVLASAHAVALVGVVGLRERLARIGRDGDRRRRRSGVRWRRVGIGCCCCCC